MQKHHIYTEVEEQFLRDNIGKYTYLELTSKFNEKFGTNLRLHSISDKCCKSMKIKRNCNTGQIQKGAKPKYQIGSEIMKQGYVWIKFNDKYFDRKVTMENYKENWMPKHRYVYEKLYGSIPDGAIVIFLDGNRENFDIDNLYCVDRKIHAVMCNNKWYTDSREHTLTAIKWCELFYTMKEGG